MSFFILNSIQILITYYFTMKKNIIIIVTVLNCLLCFSCSKNPDDSSDLLSTNGPSNLNITATIVGKTAENPNGDGSGNVNFTFNANNATSYKIDFGNGEIKTVKEGIFSYSYTNPGIKSYTIRITAINLNKEISTTIPINLYVASRIIFSDEFNIDGAPNSTYWGYDLGAGGWGNNEEQYYTNRIENVIVKDGFLKINTIKEAYQGSKYTSARLLTKDKFPFKYGKIEFRAKLPIGGGTWPALWTLGSNLGTAGWPACGEMDVMEHVYNQKDKIHGTFHYPGHSGGNGTTAAVNIVNATTEFHIYSMDWRADVIKIYVDNQKIIEFPNTNATPFNQEFFIIINCAIGGGFGGSIDPNFTSSTFEIDYVRVYN
jgi:hypothetical protein